MRQLDEGRRAELERARRAHVRRALCDVIDYLEHPPPDDAAWIRGELIAIAALRRYALTFTDETKAGEVFEELDDINTKMDERFADLDTDPIDLMIEGKPETALEVFGLKGFG
jgi:hypothetical protein